MSAVAAKRVILKNKVGEYIVPEIAKASEALEGNMDPITSDAVFKALALLGGGKNIGEIFAYPSALPPEGAYLLNGQTIANCRGLYPKFWEWLTDNAGDMIETPSYKAWTMPALTANGTLGGSEYAAELSRTPASGYAAYKSFDGTHGGANSYANIEGAASGSLTWYSPKKLKIKQLVFLNPTAGTIANRMARFDIFGSNGGSIWEKLASGVVESTANGAAQTVEIPESIYSVDNPGFQYLKIEANSGGGNHLNFPEITIYGQEYIGTQYTGNGNVLALSNEAYEYTLARAGVCGGFVIDSATGNVRLPEIVNGTLWGADSNSIGQSLEAGLPNITGVSPSSDYGNSDTVQPPAVRVSWCIQVFNAATALSEQESAQLASQIQMKARTDFSNVAENLDFVVEKWSDGAGGWYRKYRSGWVEQGGIVNSSEGIKTVTFWVEMADNKYTVSKTNDNTSTNATPGRASNSTWDRTVYDMKLYTYADANTTWEIKGYAATE